MTLIAIIRWPKPLLGPSGSSHGVPMLAPHELDHLVLDRPVDLDLPFVAAQGAIFDRVGVELVKDHRQAEHLARLEQQFGPAETRAAGRDFGAEHAVGQRRDRDVLPHLPDEQLVRAGKAFEPSREARR